MKYLLMIPGPVEIPDDILETLKGQPVAHYGPEWTKLYLDTTEAVSRTLESNGMTFIMPGSGSLGIDAVCASFCSGKKCLVLHNGQFGERLLDIASKHTNDVEVLRFPLNVPIDEEDVRNKLKNGSYDVLMMAHVETSTGILNPAENIGELAKTYGVLYILDAVSSAAIERLEMDRWSVDVTITASQKGFECPPGLALVTVRTGLLDRLKNVSVRSWYANLQTWLEYFEKWHDWHPFPVTLPTSTIVGFSKSLEIIETEGIASRQMMYRTVSNKLRKALLALGLEMFVPESSCAHGLTAVSTSGKFMPGDLIRFLKEKLDIQITGSFGELQSSVFRIGHMSRKQCHTRNLLSVISGIALFMNSCGIGAVYEDACKALIE